MQIRMIAFVMVVHVTACLAGAEPPKGIRIDVPSGWKQERIKLPPTFARDMKLHGIEEVRFAPGMFQAKSESFFSYLFVFRLKTKPELTRKVIERELLVYYRGLARTVLKSQNVTVDTSKFSFKLKETKSIDSKANLPAGLKQYAGDVKWIEPFVTRKSQTLHLEVQSWTIAKTKHNYLFVCVSPKESTATIWRTMRKLRSSFHRQK